MLRLLWLERIGRLRGIEWDQKFWSISWLWLYGIGYIAVRFVVLSMVYLLLLHLAFFFWFLLVILSFVLILVKTDRHDHLRSLSMVKGFSRRVDTYYCHS